MIITLTDKNFNEEVEKSTSLVLVDFWAPWCGPCKIQGPIVEEIANELAGKVKVGKLDVDENPQMATKFGIMSIPTLAVFKDGKVIETMIGLQTKDIIKKSLSKLSNS